MRIRTSLILLVGLVLWPALSPAESLFQKTDSPRFEVRDIEWPEKEGQASICLWADDKLAAFSFGVDDNNPGDVNWWLEQCQACNLHMTWYLVTNRIGDGQGLSPWSLWKKVLDAGHALESHSVTHLAAADQPDWKGLDWEYGQSLKDIEAGVPGCRVLCLAYPGGANGSKNDPGVARKYYLAARLFGPGPNGANTVDYYRVFSDAKADVSSGSGDGSDLKPNNYNNILLANGPHKRLYRGWAHAYMHGVMPNESKQEALKVLNWYKEHSDLLWAGLMRDVARYGQEREGASLVVDENTPTKIAFTLTDKLDERFDYPLTIKVKIPAAWKTVQATQQDKGVEARMVEHQDSKFVLVKAVPDKGQVLIVP